ncbi:MAG TPA: ACP S-malonyltransferase [Acidimicrobiales bacterium]|nr:ACP S-malonyltransferase [Acidimicrobiales bacterium]
MTYAVIFPGQGAAVPGAGAPWVDHAAWQVVREAEAATGRPLARLLLDADADELATTGASQMAVLLTSLVAWHALSDLVPAPPVAFAGHSLGQVTALLASATVAPAEGYRLAAARADASQRSADARPGRMVALMGTDPDAVAALCAEGDDAWVANDNAPGQVVAAGTPEGVDALAERAKAAGIRKVMPLAVGHAFHTPLLADAAAELAPTLAATTFRASTAPIVTNTDAATVDDPTDWPDLLTRHLVEPVRWRETQLALAGCGAATFVEVGPGRVLAGLAKRTVPDVTVLNVATPADLPAVAAALAGAADPTPAGAGR